MKITRLAGLAAFVAASLLLAGSSSQAGFIPLTTTLDQLLPAGNFTTVPTVAPVLTFSNFTYTSSGTVPVAASSITVSALDSNGIQFAAPFVAATPNSGDSLIGMTVSSTLGLTSLTLSGNPAVSGTGIASITETIFNSAGTIIGQLLVTPTTANLSQTFTFAPGTTSVSVLKDIAFAGGTAGTGQISFVRQTFTTGVPEPASVVMMGLGLVGAIGVVRLRRKPVVA